MMLVDNGRFDDVGRIAADYAVEAAAALAPILRAGQAGGGATSNRRPSARWTELSARSQRRLAGLAQRIAKSATAAHPGLDLSEQLALGPSHVIGVEDITAASWLRLGLDVDLHSDARADLRRRNRAVARAAAAIVSDGSAALGPVQYLPVASAMDYDTAFDAARVFAASGLSGAATGFGAYMADDTYVDRFKRDGRWRTLPTRVPQRYLRTIVVALGFWDGWAAETRGKAPAHFHFLGLGAPIMLGLVALVAHGSDELTFDATSPIRDAVEGTIYTHLPTPLKLRTRVLAVRLMEDPAFRWRCKCPFCRSYLAQHPFDREAGFRWRSRNPARPLTAADLRGGTTLGRAFPLLAEPRGGKARADVDRARIGHNHWTIERIVADINKHRTRGQLAGRQDELVALYTERTNADSFARAVRIAFSLAATGDLP
jgi:hypothetical protein